MFENTTGPAIEGILPDSLLYHKQLHNNTRWV